MDFKRVINELLAKGLRQRYIAKTCGCEESVVFRLKTGKQKTIFYDQGAAIVEMARAHGVQV